MTASLQESRRQLLAFIQTKPPRHIFYHLFNALKELKAVFNKEAETRFFNMLRAVPELEKYWDIEEGTAKIKSIQMEITRNPDESAMLSFLGSVWFGNSDMFSFDFMHAMKHMKEREIKIVRRWMASPFWP